MAAGRHFSDEAVAYFRRWRQATYGPEKVYPSWASTAGRPVLKRWNAEMWRLVMAGELPNPPKPRCPLCGVRTREFRGWRTDRTKAYRATCRECRRRPARARLLPLMGARICAGCGFVPYHLAQLEIDHIDGDRTNNERANLRWLCANCHRLATMGLPLPT